MKVNVIKNLVLTAGVILGISLACGKTAFASEPVILPASSEEPSEGCVFLGVEGEYITQAEAALKRINEIRKEACDEGVKNPDTNKPLTAADYKPMVWSEDLEYIARIRAAEACILMEHTRPNGSLCFNLSSPGGVSSQGENLAWNWGFDMLTGIEQWYGEKSIWVNGGSGVTGHYTSMISPTFQLVGLGTFWSNEGSYRNTTCAEFMEKTSLSQKQGEAVSSCIQTVEVKNSYIKSLSCNMEDRIAIGKEQKLEVRAATSLGKNNKGEFRLLKPIAWSVDDTEVAMLSADNILTGVSKGTTTVTAASGGITCSSEITVYCEHEEVIDEGKDATCTETGLTEGKHCSKCGEVLVKQEVIPAGHKEVIEEAKAATCTEPGLTEGRYCKVCKEIFAVQEEIPALGHREVDTDEQAPTCTEPGFMPGSRCSVCGMTMSGRDEIAPMGHSFGPWKTVKKAQPGIAGRKERVCSVCGGTEEEKIPALKSENMKVSSIRISTPLSYQIAAGKSVTLKASVIPDSAAEQGVVWSSSNPKVAKVNQKGKVTVLKRSGGKKAVITAAAKDGSGVKASVIIKSMKGAVKSISLSGKKSVKAGKSVKLKAKVKASKGANKKLIWKSSNSQAATVSGSGKVTAKRSAKGKKVKITAMAADGSGKKKSLTIKIK